MKANMPITPLATAHLVKLTWHPSYECGHALIDKQHKALFRDANNLLDAMLCEQPAGRVTELIDALINDVVQHFQDEEIVYVEAGYPGAVEHTEIHRSLVEQAAQLANRFHGGNQVLGELFEFLAHDLIARHMLGEDREFFVYMSRRAG